MALDLPQQIILVNLIHNLCSLQGILNSSNRCLRTLFRVIFMQDLTIRCVFLWSQTGPLQLGLFVDSFAPPHEHFLRRFEFSNVRLRESNSACILDQLRIQPVGGPRNAYNWYLKLFFFVCTDWLSTGNLPLRMFGSCFLVFNSHSVGVDVQPFAIKGMVHL